MYRFIVRVVGWITPILLIGCNNTMVHTNYKSLVSSTIIVSRQIDKSRIKKVLWQEIPGWKSDSMIGTAHALHQNCLRLALREEWRLACSKSNKLKELDTNSMRTFFEENFIPYQFIDTNGSLDALITGYYEPLLCGSHIRRGKYQYPLYHWPISYRIGTPLPTRAKLKNEGLLSGNELVWIDNQIDAFFAQIQGSGRILFEDGSVMYLGFGGANNQPYCSIGKWLLDHGEITSSQLTMQGIKTWALANPKRVDTILNINPRFVFFKEIQMEKIKLRDGDNDGPLGALGVLLTPERSIAVDPTSIPLGTVVFLQTTCPKTDKPMNRLVFAQDIGSAIKGGLRADYFWGIGDHAYNQAGKMKQVGRMWLLLPKA